MSSGDYEETDWIHLGAGTPSTASRATRPLMTPAASPAGANAEMVDSTVPLPASGGQYGHSDSVRLTYISGAPIIAGSFPAESATRALTGAHPSRACESPPGTATLESA